MMRPIDNLLNRTTMYQLVYYGLLALYGLAVVLGFVGLLAYSGLAIMLSGLWLLTVCRITNIGLAKLFGAATNFESPAITALILTLILLPAMTSHGFITITLTAVLAIASKYLIVWRGRHLLNPAAAGLVGAGLLGSGLAVWWIGTPLMLPAVIILGILVVRKLQRFRFVTAAIATALVTMVVVSLIQQGSASFDTVTLAFTSWPLIFFTTIMLTEPATIPATRTRRLVYSVFAGWLFASQLHWGPIASTPEVVLVAGNLLGALMGRGRRLRLKLVRQQPLAAATQEFVFATSTKLDFKPGQYLEWTLPHPHADNRGSRRYFTIASSPTESEIHLGIKLGPGRISSFKTALAALTPAKSLSATGPSGDFILPAKSATKLIWIAGGIGVTPFRAQAKYLLDSGQSRDIILLYLASRPDSFAYRELFDQAAAIGLRSHYILDAPDTSGWDGPTGRLDGPLLARLAPDFGERHFYISGPSGLIRAQKHTLRHAGVPAARIITDDFPGF